MNQIIEAGAAKLAGLQIDLLQKMRQGKIGMNHLEWFIRLKPDMREALMRGEYELKPIAQATGDTFDSAKYFVTRDGLYVWPEFAQRILPAYQGLIPKRGIEGVHSVDLPRNMYDREIVAEYLGGEEEARKHAFTPDQVADLIDTQKGGKAGVLLNNGYANLLYMIGVCDVLFPVSVDWRSVNSCWHVRAYQFDDARWRAGLRVLRNKR
ncbi:MAG: hypothetical protein KBC21_03815 [Candidatus Pacebacteria bacterium]|nr:hypothetical protein [Candidatus Paceibacterota bacterium]